MAAVVAVGVEVEVVEAVMVWLYIQAPQMTCFDEGHNEE